MYKNILFALELIDAANLVGKKINTGEAFQEKLNLISVDELAKNVIFPEITDKYKLPPGTKNRFGIGEKLNAPLFNQCLEVGNPRTVIPEFIEQHNIHLLR